MLQPIRSNIAQSPPTRNYLYFYQRHTMAAPAKALDHLVLFIPVDAATKLPRTPAFFSDNFTLSPGGFHADGASSNVLILLADGCYIELISFVDTKLAPKHWWGPDSTFVGWKDWCLTTSNTPEENQANLKESHSEPVHGGRKRADGVDVKWAVTFPKGENGGQDLRGRLPFFCHDITPREVRVPIQTQNTTHASGATGVKELTVIVKDQDHLDKTRRSYAAILGGEGVVVDDDCISFQVGRVHEVRDLEAGPTILLRLPRDQEEVEYVKESGFMFGDVVLGAKARGGTKPGTKKRLDGADNEYSVRGLWIEYL